MVRFSQSHSWVSNPDESYIPVLYEKEVVGFCKPHYATRIITILNEDEISRKALQAACTDLIARMGRTDIGVADLMQQYIELVSRPKHGVAAIAFYLKERQAELDLTDEEFAKFCDTFRLSRDELNAIYQGQLVDPRQLTPLSRILGMTIDDVIVVLRGD